MKYYEALMPTVVSSCASYLVFAAITHLGIAPTWHFSQYHLDKIDDFASAIIFGIIGVLAYDYLKNEFLSLTGCFKLSGSSLIFMENLLENH